MPGLAETVKRLAALAAERKLGESRPRRARLAILPSFGSNPGSLAAKTYIPADLPRNAALVVVLHGCTQTAEGYDRGSGWSQLADRHGFAVLFPEQQRANNPNLCFNWFAPGDTRRDQGEALSIRQMIHSLVREHGLDAGRIYVTGLSAGGAMASVMLATYPEMFAGGAIIAGLPYGVASGVPEALDRMRGQGLPAEAELARLVRDASDHNGPWPAISVWHGSSDATVASSNAAAIVGQWRKLHGARLEPARTDIVDTYPHRVWTDGAGRDVIEEYNITGMGHGTPLDPAGKDGCGEAGAYMLDVRINSTRHIAHFWGIDRVAGTAAASETPQPARAAVNDGGQRVAASNLPTLEGRRPERIHAAPAATPANQIGKVIEDALRAAGLMR